MTTPLPNEEQEYLTSVGHKDRLTLFPIKDQAMWNMYHKALSAFWTPSEVDLSRDRADWDNLNANERNFIKQILAFFSSADTIVNINLAERFINDVTVMEARFFYAFQMAIENVHSETYSLLIDTYVKDTQEKARLFDAVHVNPTIQRKSDWCFRFIESKSASFGQRLIAFAIVEGVFFSGSFAAIFWLKERGGKLPGLAFANELISRDESLHVEFAVLLYSKLSDRARVDQDRVHDMFKSAVSLEADFITSSIPCSMLGMNSALMSQYIQYVADRLLMQLGYDKLFKSNNPFPFMERIGMENKTNFFEGRVAEYAKPISSSNKTTDVSTKMVFNEDADF
jgi:ribonucleoside-diphosphate reductase subunit M2